MVNLTNFGQHFLTDGAVIKDFIGNCHLTGNEHVLEVGPGKGALTPFLCQKAKKVTAVEIDPQFKTELLQLSRRYSNLKVVFKNVLKLHSYKYDLVCGALSFAIFEPLMIRLIRKPPPKRLVFLVSGKVKDSFLARRGLLYYLLNSFFKVEFGAKVLPQAFSPKPHTAGVIIKLTPKIPKDTLFLIWREKFLKDPTVWQLPSEAFREI